MIRSLLVSLLAPALLAAESVDLDTLMRIRDEGFKNSRVMETAATLTDRIGARLTGSPNMGEANEWTRHQLEEWGLVNAQVEPWGPFGRGWQYDSVSVRMLSPDLTPLYALPKAWSPGTDGPIRAKAVAVNIKSRDDLEQYKGRLAGLIVVNGEKRDLAPLEKGFLKRHDEKSLEELAQYAVSVPRTRRDEAVRRRGLRRAINDFMIAEKAAALIEPGSGGEGGTFDVQSGGSHRLTEPVGVPSLVMNIEHFNRLARLLAAKHDVELEVDVRASLVNEAPVANTIAEIPGTDKKQEIVMLGAHLDSWHTGTGATDNAAGVAAMMEAVRILKAIGVKPRRTIRIALWSGEEQGLLGSRAYVAKHFATRPEPKDPAQRELPANLRTEKGPLSFKPAYARLSAYFNMDNGTGRIRGIYAQENLPASELFKQWIEPLRDLGVTTVSVRTTSSTDHIPFDEVGLPGFQFIQDDVEYSGRSHHSNADVFDRLQRPDLIQASVVIAAFVYQAAMRDDLMPRKPLPRDEPPAVQQDDP